MNVLEPTTFLLRYHEIAIKGDNRSWFEKRLLDNVNKLLDRHFAKEGLPKRPFRTWREHGRIFVEAIDSPELRDVLICNFGMTSFSPTHIVPTDLSILKDRAVEICEQIFKTRSAEQLKGLTFRVLTRRSEKALKETSTEIDCEVGSAIQLKFPELKVDLKNAKFTLGIEIRNRRSYIWTEKVKTHGGLPAATQGHLLALLSGGIDSPVAAIQLIKRGAICSFIHFYGAPFIGPEALEKVMALAKIVNRYQPKPQPVYVVRFGEIQEEIAKLVDPKMLTLLYRRLMFGIAERIAAQINAQALVTGEALGQVASQTLDNIESVSSGRAISILRPLIAHDKEEIVDLAKKFKTYETSIIESADCCTLFADRHPMIRCSIEKILKVEELISLESLIQKGLENTVAASAT